MRKKKNNRIFVRILAGMLALSMWVMLMPVPVLAADTASSTATSGTSGGSISAAPDEGSGDEYNRAISTSEFLLPANTWVTPVATHGQYVYVVLPLVNMFKYNIKDVVISPVISTKTDEWPFEIENTGYTEKLATLAGEDAVPDVKDRVQNCVWCFKTRDNVKTGYYKLDFSVVYTNSACAIEQCTISTFVKTVGLAKNGTTDGEDKDKKASTPRVIVKGFTTDPAEIYAGNTFSLTVTIENTSRTTAVNNLELDLTGTVTGKDDASSYAAFLPTSGSNSFYVDSIPAGGTTDLTMEFEAKADLEQKPYVMDIKMAYEDDEANPFTGEANVSIPIKQVSKFDMSTPDIEPASIDIGGQSDVMFSIYNTGKTKLYNVSVSLNDASIDPATAYVGSLQSGATGNVDMMVTGAQYTADLGEDGNIDCVISYEDEAGNVTKVTKQIMLTVAQDMSAANYTEDSTDVPAETAGPSKKMMIIIAVSVVAAVILLIVVIKLIRKHKKKKEEKELADLKEDEEDTEDNETK